MENSGFLIPKRLTQVATIVNLTFEREILTSNCQKKSGLGLLGLEERPVLLRLQQLTLNLTIAKKVGFWISGKHRAKEGKKGLGDSLTQ